MWWEGAPIQACIPIGVNRIASPNPRSRLPPNYVGPQRLVVPLGAARAKQNARWRHDDESRDRGWLRCNFEAERRELPCTGMLMMTLLWWECERIKIYTKTVPGTVYRHHIIMLLPFFMYNVRRFSDDAYV